jgi:hypothetical protein
MALDDAKPNVPGEPATASGAIPPTGGVPPEDAGPAAKPGHDPQSAGDDLADGIDLLLRAARKALKSVDPRVEAAAQQAVTRLQALDAQAAEALRKNLGVDPRQIDELATEIGRDLVAVVQRVAERVEATFGRAR